MGLEKIIDERKNKVPNKISNFFNYTKNVMCKPRQFPLMNNLPTKIFVGMIILITYSIFSYALLEGIKKYKELNNCIENREALTNYVIDLNRMRLDSKKGKITLPGGSGYLVFHPNRKRLIFYRYGSKDKLTLVGEYQLIDNGHDGIVDQIKEFDVTGIKDYFREDPGSEDKFNNADNTLRNIKFELGIKSYNSIKK